MYDVLKQHAVENVWCSPEQDNQIVLAPARISRPQGELISFQYMMRSIAMPSKGSRYHVFSINQAHPSILGLLPTIPDWSVAGWTKFSDAVEQLILYCDIYTDAGIHLPLHRCYYMYTNDRALIVAVDSSAGSPIDYMKDRVYLRFYSNAYFGTTEGSVLSTDTRAIGGSIVVSDDILTYQNQLAAWSSLPGRSLSFINGQYVDTISPFTTVVGDVVELYHDTSIKTVYDFKVKDCPTFTSSLDGCYKYLLHPAKDSEGILNYYDDIDLYLVHKTEKGEVGHFCHRNTKHSVRMVTHRDYSVPVDHIAMIAQSLSDTLGGAPLDFRELTIRVFVRKAGISRPLIHDHHRVFELYKLKDSAILGAMVGDEAVMPYWTADALESSAYVTLMRADYVGINIDLINDAYGYNSITQVIGETPSRVIPYGEYSLVMLPPVLQVNSTLYEYDVNGALLGFSTHSSGDSDAMKYTTTQLVEGIVGKGTDRLIKQTGQDNLIIPTKYSYRVYMCYLVNGIPNKVWKDITGSAYYNIVGGLLKWSGLETNQWLEIRSDESFLAYTVEIFPTNGVLYFPLTEVVGENTEVLSIPLGDLDLWMNGKALIENLDYRVEFPKVTILNKEFLNQPVATQKQVITVRFTGFCNKDLTWKPAEDYGFIEHGVLSNNTRFDVRDDKVVRITVAGAFKHRDSLLFSEEHSGVSILNVLNGRPYQIKDIVVPLRELSDEETYALREKSVVVDTAVEDYMTRMLPEPTREGIMAISSKWTVVSPFLSRIVSDIVSGLLPVTTFTKPLSDGDVMMICKPYEAYLVSDPLNPDFKTEYAYVAVQPTLSNAPIGLALDAYRFMQKVVALYGRGVVTLNSHLTVSLGGN